MTASSTASPRSLPIVEVGRLCADVATSSGRLFELAGLCVARCDVASRQRRYTAACDRHGWHRQLAIDRSPRIPLVPPIEEVRTDSPTSTEADGPPTAIERMWRDDAEALRARLLATYPLLSPELDPATARLIQLVVSDLDELLQEITPPGVSLPS